MCPEYWSNLDPCEDALLEPTRMQRKLHKALRESFISRNLPTLPLPAFLQLPRIANQRDAPRPLRSRGTFAVSTTLHLLLGGHAPPLSPYPIYHPGTHDGPTNGPCFVRFVCLIWLQHPLKRAARSML